MILLTVGLFLNVFFSKLLKAPTNVESVYITCLILFFLLLPPSSISDIWMLALAAFLAIGSKFIIAINKKHIFNPAAFAAVLLGAVGIGASLWWIGIPAFLPFTLICGFLIVRKIRKFKMFLTFIAVSTTVAMIFGVLKGASPAEVIAFMYTSGPVIFFASIMFTEPSTSPPTFKKQFIYAIIVGLLYGSQFRIGPIFSSPELALVLGNIYSYFVSQKEKLTLTLQNSREIAKDTYEFIFTPPHKIHYAPGQYFEWTLSHKNSDARGVRRYFTIASSPTENQLKLGIKMSPVSGSSFKKKLLSLKPGDLLIAGQLAGDFILPKEKNKKLVFIAGGIGITPFRSMIEYLIDSNESRQVILFYSNKTFDEIAYKDIFQKAQKNGIITVYVLTDEKNVPHEFNGETGRINEAMIKKYVTDIKQRTYYLSGPAAMVHAYKEMLVGMGVTDIVTDYFPGL